MIVTDYMDVHKEMSDIFLLYILFPALIYFWSIDPLNSQYSSYVMVLGVG